jgi:hypothetical protein
MTLAEVYNQQKEDDIEMIVWNKFI